MQMLSDRRPESIDAALPEPDVFGTDHTQVAIFLPRLDLPWKALAEDVQVPRVKEDIVALRLYWKRFAVHLANALERQGVHVAIHEIHAADITPEIIDGMGYRIAFVPHHCYLDFKPRKTKVFYFMQEYFRWIFVVDSNGWGASSSVYPLQIDALVPMKKGTFDSYRGKLLNGDLESKFGQFEHKSYVHLVYSGQIPLRRYIFFPLQIPHDQSIHYFSEYTEDEIVDAVLDWSRSSGIPIVFKPHPISQKAMAPFKDRVKAAGAYWSTANVQDLIRHATAVFTINSGVGFEALFQLKPVVTFGRAEYDCVTFHATPETIKDAWHASQVVPAAELEKRYSRFVDYFLSSYAIDLSCMRTASARLDAIASAVHQVIVE